MGGVFLFFCDLLSQGSQRTLYGFLYACLPYWCGGPLQYGGGASVGVTGPSIAQNLYKVLYCLIGARSARPLAAD